MESPSGNLLSVDYGFLYIYEKKCAKNDTRHIICKIMQSIQRKVVTMTFERCNRSQSKFHCLVFIKIYCYHRSSYSLQSKHLHIFYFPSKICFLGITWPLNWILASSLYNAQRSVFHTVPALRFELIRTEHAGPQLVNWI